MTDTGLASVMAQPSAQDDLDLNEDQIQQLLLEAEGRLRGANVPAPQESEFASLR